MLQLNNLSASSINEFITNRSMWFAKKFQGLKTPGSLPMARGRAVESGINYFLSQDNPDITKSIEAAMAEYNKSTELLEDDISFRQTIAPLVVLGTNHFFSVSEALKSKPIQQHKLEFSIGSNILPIIGYLDYIWPSRCIRDCKVTGKKPSGLMDSYKIQGALYKYATNLPVVFTFIIATKEPSVLEIKLSEEDYKWGISVAKKAAEAIQTILDNPIDGRLVEAFMFPNTDAGYSKDDVNLILNHYHILDE